MRIACPYVLAIAGLMALTGCSALAPFPTYPRMAGPGEEATALRVAMCYDALVSSLDEVQAAAQQECPANTTAAYFDTDWRLEFCPLLLPARATFACAPKK
jgi:hypothetical protein